MVDVRGSYLELIHRFPLATVKSDVALADALNIIDELIDRKKLDEGERMYFDELVRLVEEYKAKPFPFPDVDPRAKPT